MDINKQEMEIMHTMCKNELQELQLSLNNFLLESERVQKILGGKKSASTCNDGYVPSCGAVGDGTGKRNNMFALIAFDRYMSQVGNVVNMARKFNIHLKLNKLTNAVINPAANNSMEAGNVMAQSRILQDYIEWSNTRLDIDLANNDIGLEITESLTWKNDNVLTFNQEDDVFKKETLEASQNLKQMVNEVKNVERKKPDEPDKQILEKLDEFLNILFPTKDLSQFQQDYEFSGSIIYVQDYQDLVFFICDLKDYNILYEFSHTDNLTPIPHSSPITDAVFCVAQGNGEIEEKRECVWRAVMVPEEGNHAPDSSIYLVDCGEIIPLTKQCKLYRVPAEYRKIAPLAIKCILKGLHNRQTRFITRDHAECEKALRCSEYEIAQFRVVQQQNRVLHLVLVEKASNEVSGKQKTISNETATCQQTISSRNSNPFLNNSFVFNNDEENSKDNLDPLPLPLSAVYSSSSSMPSYPSTPLVNKNAQLGDKLKILVTHIINPIKFYAIIEDDSYDHSKAFSWPDHEIAMLQKQMSPPQINDIVLAQYIKDRYWYRARVIDVMSDQDLYKVFYVDFGNTENVPLCCLANCNKKHLEDPLRAVLFRMANLSIPMDNDKDDDTLLLAIDVRLQKAIETVVVLLLDQTLNVDVVDRHNGELIIRLTDQQYADLPEILIDMGVVEKV